MRSVIMLEPGVEPLEKRGVGYKNVEVMEGIWAPGRPWKEGRGEEGESLYMPGSQLLASGQGQPSRVIPVHPLTYTFLNFLKLVL